MKSWIRKHLAPLGGACLAVMVAGALLSSASRRAAPALFWLGTALVAAGLVLLLAVGLLGLAGPPVCPGCKAKLPNGRQAGAARLRDPDGLLRCPRCGAILDGALRR